MKKALAVVLALATVVGLIVWVAPWFRTPEVVAASGAESWPGELGPLEAVAARYPPLETNEAAANLTARVNAIAKNEAVDAFVGREMMRGELTIGEAPPLPDVAAIRDLLLREEIIWGRPGGIGEIGDQETSARRVVQMTTARFLIASALAKARAGDAAAWEDLHAVWNLARSIEGQPQMMSQTAALSMVRMINAVAWKMPLPVPEWFGELQSRDDLRPLLESFQYQAASYWESGAQLFPTKSLADSVAHDRRIAEQLLQVRSCDVNTPMNSLGTDLSFVWRRAFRYRAEQEAASNALRVREGKPIDPSSRCSDGSWTFDGTTLRFSREIATTPPDQPMPLVLRVRG